MGRSEPRGGKDRELAGMATEVISTGRREGQQANDWQTFNKKRINQAKTGLFMQNRIPRGLRAHGNFILESSRDLGRLCEMAQ